MTKEELYLKTVFCSMACDGDIASEEVKLVKELCANNALFEGMDAEKYINLWIAEINTKGSRAKRAGANVASGPCIEDHRGRQRN